MSGKEHGSNALRAAPSMSGLDSFRDSGNARRTEQLEAERLKKEGRVATGRYTREIQQLKGKQSQFQKRLSMSNIAGAAPSTAGMSIVGGSPKGSVEELPKLDRKMSTTKLDEGMIAKRVSSLFTSMSQLPTPGKPGGGALASQRSSESLPSAAGKDDTSGGGSIGGSGSLLSTTSGVDLASGGMKSTSTLNGGGGGGSNNSNNGKPAMMPRRGSILSSELRGDYTGGGSLPQRRASVSASEVTRHAGSSIQQTSQAAVRAAKAEQIKRKKEQSSGAGYGDLFDALVQAGVPFDLHLPKPVRPGHENDSDDEGSGSRALLPQAEGDDVRSPSPNQGKAGLGGLKVGSISQLGHAGTDGADTNSDDALNAKSMPSKVAAGARSLDSFSSSEKLHIQKDQRDMLKRAVTGQTGSETIDQNPAVSPLMSLDRIHE